MNTLFHLLRRFFFFFFFFFFFLLLSPAQSQVNSNNCTDTCGSRKVFYPFCFSSSCPIPLSCAGPNNSISLSSLPLRNISSDTIRVELPPRCNRSVGTAKNSLFSNNFAPTRKNALLFRNCTASSPTITTNTSCVISTRIFSDGLNLTHCGPRSDNLTCSTDQTTNGSYSSRDYLEGAGCGFLFTSVVFEVDVLVIDAVELGWWVEGEECRCSHNANCTKVSTPVGPGFRCRCNEGFEGSGFMDGGGCYRVITSCGSTNCRSSKIPVLIGGIVAGGSLLACIAVVLYFLHHRCSARRLRKYTRRLYSEASSNVPFYSYREIERATESFSEAHRLGTGAYGTVYVGQLENGDLVAVKKIKHPDPDTIGHVMNEVKMISSLHHPNLVRLLGCCIERGEQILVYEFMPHGTLSQHLQRQRGPGLPWAVRLSIAAETAKAIDYLHSSVEPPIYHRDVKSSNILLDHQFSAKIADFGLSRAAVADSSHISTAPQGTPGYVDPQYHQNYHLSDKSDVYSFGVVLVEIITGMKVVDFNRGQSEINLAAMAVDRIAKGTLEEIVDPFLNVQKGSWSWDSVHKVAELAFRCLAFHRDMRPSMMEVSDELEQIRLSGWAPKDGDVVVSEELCSSTRSMEGAADGLGSAEKSKRLVLANEIECIEEFSPVSVQDAWPSDLTTAPNSS